MKKILVLISALLCFGASVVYGQQRSITGRITDAKGQPIPVATIRVVGTNNGTTADANGRFEITAKTGSELEITSIGFMKRLVKVLGNSRSLNIVLKPNSNLLQATVVTALGISRQERRIGYAVSTVQGSDIVRTSPTNFVSALYGRVPGMSINTNPGGANSAVSVQIRGLNSITNPSQPLLVVDGIVVRDGEANNNGYWGGPRIEGNGILDINPDNIAKVTILRGAAAAALYGSDAANGVIVVTTKSGHKQKGLGIDFSESANIVTVGILPPVQTEFGPGYDRTTNEELGTDAEGWIHSVYNGDSVEYPRWQSWGQFGPKIDGRPVLYWDGKIRPYTSHDNWKNFYQKGLNTTENIALSNATEKVNYRFSYTRNDYKGIAVGSNEGKNTFNLNTTFHITPRLSTNVMVSYINSLVHNSPWQVDRMTDNYTGMIGPANDINLFKQNYKTPQGYKYQTPGNASLSPGEALALNTDGTDYMDYFWNQLAVSDDQTTNRVIAAATLSYDILKNLHFRGRMGEDYTGYFSEDKEPSQYPVAFGYSGYYGTNFNRYNFTYGDLLLTYDQKITDNFNVSLSAGYQARTEDYRYSSQGTSGGLTQKNWYTMSASANPVTGSSTRSYLVKDGLFGILDLSYHNYLFIEATGRRERSSTLFPGHNSFFYPGVSGSFELSNAFHLPAFVTYSKLRASWAIVGNPGVPYQANVVYNAYSVNGVPTLTTQNPYGNQNLKDEKKHAVEFGWETKLFNDRFGFDISWYHNRIHDQILNLQVPASTGVTGVLENVGTMQNIGLEIALNGTPIQTPNFQWNVTLNWARNHNTVLSLMPGLQRLVSSNMDNGSLLIVSEVGKAAGEIMSYKLERNAAGQMIVNNGYYVPNFDSMVNVGNVQSKFVGGLINDFRYKGFDLNIVTDFRWGGQIFSPAILYGTGAGLYTNSLFGRDATLGGLPYYVDANGNYVGESAGTTSGPQGQPIYHDGMVLKGVTSDGKPNTTIIDAPSYYLNSFTWGEYPGSGADGTYTSDVFNNNYIKLREISLSYTFQLKMMSKFKLQNLMLTLYGSNLFYFYKSLPYLDPEEGIGTNYLSLATEGGEMAASRSYGASLQVSF